MRRRSIKTRLILLATVSGIAAVVVASTSFVLNDLVLLRDSKWQQLRSQAQLLASNAAPALEAHDLPAAEQLLRSLVSQPCIESAELFDVANRSWTSVQFAAGAACTTEPHAPPGWLGELTTATGDYEIHYPVTLRGQRFGTLCLRANAHDVQGHLVDNLLLAGIVAFCSALLSVQLAAMLQRRLAEPILRLAAFTHEIAHRGDYAARITPSTNDEIGDLYAAFNQLLAKVESSEAALLSAQAQLADRVGERTTQLLEEMDQRRRMQTELAAAQDETEAAHRAKSTFLANASFEIRSPLNAILGYSDLLRRGEARDEHEAQAFLETIATSARHLAVLLGDVLDLSAIESGQLLVEMRTCAPDELLHEVLAMLRPMAADKALSLDYVAHEPLPAAILTDPLRLRQALLSIVGHGLKHTAVGGVRLEARISQQPGRWQLQVRVIDTAIDCNTAHVQRQLDLPPLAVASDREFEHASEMGLAIARRIARALGGDLTVSGEPGAGCTFELTVDAGPHPSPATTAADDDARLDEVVAETTHFLLHGAHVLLAEDGDANRRLIQVVLQRAGATVVSVANGREAVEAALDDDFDLILMDMQMPELDGYAATERLRAENVATPILALTANAMQSDEAKCLAAGCTAYLAKPIEPQRLLHEVEALLARRPRLELPVYPPMLPPPERPTISQPTETLRSTLPAEDDEFREIVGEFVGRFNDRLGEMRSVLSSGDLNRLGELAHWLKGSGGTAGFAQLSDVATDLLSASLESNSHQANRVLDELEDLAARIEVPGTAPSQDGEGGSIAPRRTSSP